MKYGAAIEINPKWQSVELDQAKQLLVYRLMRESGHLIEDILPNTTFEQRDRQLIAFYRVPDRSRVAWPIG